MNAKLLILIGLGGVALIVALVKMPWRVTFILIFIAIICYAVYLALRLQFFKDD